MGRANRQGGVSGAFSIPRAGLMRVGDIVDGCLSHGPVRIERIEVGGKSVDAVPWVAANEATLETSDGRQVHGGMCDPRRFSPQREIEEILSDGQPQTFEYLAEKTGWAHSDLAPILEESDNVDRRSGNRYVLRKDPSGEDRLSSFVTGRSDIKGILAIGDWIETPWGKREVAEISLSGSSSAVGVPAVPWQAAAGRDLVVKFTDKEWAYGEQISPLVKSVEEKITAELKRGEKSASELALACKVSEREVEATLQAMKDVGSRRAFTRNDEYMLYFIHR